MHELKKVQDQGSGGPDYLVHFFAADLENVLHEQNNVNLRVKKFCEFGLIILVVLIDQFVNRFPGVQHIVEYVTKKCHKRKLNKVLL